MAYLRIRNRKSGIDNSLPVPPSLPPRHTSLPPSPSLPSHVSGARVPARPILFALMCVWASGACVCGRRRTGGRAVCVFVVWPWVVRAGVVRHATARRGVVRASVVRRGAGERAGWVAAASECVLGVCAHVCVCEYVCVCVRARACVRASHVGVQCITPTHRCCEGIRLQRVPG